MKSQEISKVIKTDPLGIMYMAIYLILVEIVECGVTSIPTETCHVCLKGLLRIPVITNIPQIVR